MDMQTKSYSIAILLERRPVIKSVAETTDFWMTKACWEHPTSSHRHCAMQ